jgi:hypothetical protein
MTAIEWQPIETAPRDGTEILAGSCYDENLSVVYWADNRWRGACDGLPAVQSQDDFGTIYHEPFVTRWMPLPPPPTDDGTQP